MNPLDLDKTPLSTDWDDLQKMLDDIRSFLREHPTHELLPADDPGSHHEPPRVARIGFTSFRMVTTEFAAENVRRMAQNLEPIEWDEQTRNWTITLPNCKNYLLRAPSLAEAFRTARGRQNLAISLKDSLRDAFTVGHTKSYDQSLREDPVVKKVGKRDDYEGGWVWKTATEARDFLTRSRATGGLHLGDNDWRNPDDFSVYLLQLPTGWPSDVSSEPDPQDKVHRLLTDSPIVRRIDI